MRVLACLALLVLPVVVACGDDGKPSQAQPISLAVYPEMTLLKPGEVGILTFQVWSQRKGNPDLEPGVNKTLDVTLEDDPTTADPEPRGATLSSALLVTNEAGQATLRVTAGLDTTFRITARLREAPLEAAAVIVVSEGQGATLEVQPSWIASATPPPALARVSVRAFDGRPCVSLSARPPSTPVRLPADVAVGGVATFSLVTGSVAVQGLGYDDAGLLRATGCLDVPAGVLRGDATSRVALPLTAVVPATAGTFLVRTTFSAKAAAEGALAPWQDVAGCPLGLAAQWLDALVAELGRRGNTAVALALDDARGARSASAATGSCPAATMGGSPSLEQALASAFPPSAPVASSATAVASDLTALFDALAMTSVLTLRSTPLADRFDATHALAGVTFTLRSATLTVAGQDLGVPGQVAYDVAVTRQLDGTLLIAAHGLALKLGTLGETAVRALVLHPRSLPEDIGAWTSGWIAEAAAASGTPGADAGTSASLADGCTALDRVLCRAANQPVGCLLAACPAATAALGANLTSALRALDGPGTDLTLSGSVFPADGDGDGKVDQLGSTTVPGLWSVTLTTATETTASNATWSGVLENP